MHLAYTLQPAKVAEMAEKSAPCNTMTLGESPEEILTSEDHGPMEMRLSSRVSTVKVRDEHWWKAN